MKPYAFLWLCLLFGFSACEEIPPVITPAGQGGNSVTTPVSEQKRQVLLEEFSGVRCVNCPAGSDAIQVLLDIYGSQLVPVNIHAGFFAEPYPESRYDFQTQAGYGILEYLGQPLGFPTAVINRKQFPGEDNLQLTQRAWAGSIADELLEAPKVKIDIIREFSPVDRALQLFIDLYPEENISSEDVRLSVFITENDIADFQLTPQGKIGDYQQKHVLREVITDFKGERLTEPLTIGQKVRKTYQMNIPEAWKSENCDIIAFVHLNGASKEVLQAHRSGLE
jgi:hypothetical protein